MKGTSRVRSVVGGCETRSNLSGLVGYTIPGRAYGYTSLFLGILACSAIRRATLQIHLRLQSYQVRIK